MKRGNLPAYEAEYRNAKRKRLLTKCIGMAISFFGIALLIIGFIKGNRYNFMFSALVLMFLFMYWTTGTFFRAIIKRKQMQEIFEKTVAKAAYDAGIFPCDEFYFDRNGQIDEDLLSYSGLMLSEGFANPFPSIQVVRNMLSQSGMKNNEYMSAEYRGCHVERANVNMYQAGESNLFVNFISIELPYDTGTEVRYMAEPFLSMNQEAGFDVMPIPGCPISSGDLFHLSGNQPTEYLVNGIIRMANHFPDPCEILVKRNRIFVILQNASYDSKVCSWPATVSEEYIRLQMAGRVSEMTMAVDAMLDAFPQGVVNQKGVSCNPTNTFRPEAGMTM